MSRPLRIEFPGAIYHVTSHGDRREPIFEDDTDRDALLGVVEEGMGRYDAQALAYCLMGNHDHFVLDTRQANLSRLIRHLNGVYTQAYNRRHGKVGHLFQGRFKTILACKTRGQVLPFAPHLAPGQGSYLPHEAWHVVQLPQGRVQPTLDVGGTLVNDNPGLEHEADVMGAKTLQRARAPR